MVHYFLKSGTCYEVFPKYFGKQTAAAEVQKLGDIRVVFSTVRPARGNVWRVRTRPAYECVR